MTTIYDQIQALSQEEYTRLFIWMGNEERARREAQPAVEQAVREQRAEDAAALWEQHPELKPTVQETPEQPVAATVEEAAAKVEIEAYKPPTGAHDSYPKGAKFIYNGRVWESQMDGYCWEPDSEGIDDRFVIDVTDRFVKTTGEESEAEAPKPAVEKPAAFKQPTGEHDAYAKGAKVTYNGAVYESLIAANAYSPDAYPTGWKKLA